MRNNVLVYYQKHFYDDGSLCSIVELKENCPELSTVCVGCFHVKKDRILLNSTSPLDKSLDKMWEDVKIAQKMGVKIVAMIGGYSAGSFVNMVNDKSRFLKLAKILKELNFDGIDLDIEEEISLESVVKLIDWVREEFGSDFIIQMAPVAPALYTNGFWSRSGDDNKPIEYSKGNMSGFSYSDLERTRGDDIDYYCAQFYCGWGSLKNTEEYDKIIEIGGYSPSKVMAGTITYEERGFLSLNTMAKTAEKLSKKYKDFAGVFCWEYALSEPGAKDKKPYIWASKMGKAMSNQVKE